MMDRAGSFAVIAALVLLSAMHIVSAPNYLNLIPVALLVVGAVRLVRARTSRDPHSDDLALAPTAEA